MLILFTHLQFRKSVTVKFLEFFKVWIYLETISWMWIKEQFPDNECNKKKCKVYNYKEICLKSTYPSSKRIRGTRDVNLKQSLPGIFLNTFSFLWCLCACNDPRTLKRKTIKSINQDFLAIISNHLPSCIVEKSDWLQNLS